MQTPIILKIVIGGDGGIGKTTLVKVFCGIPYSDQKMTIGVNFFIKKLKVNGLNGTLQIWDFSGQEHFRFLLPNYCKGAHGIVLGFDMTRRKSFQNLGKWMEILQEEFFKVPILLIATKADRGYHPTLNRALIMDFVNKFNLMGFVEVSAKENLNVEDLFKNLIENIRDLNPGTVQITFL